MDRLRFQPRHSSSRRTSLSTTRSTIGLYIIIQSSNILPLYDAYDILMSAEDSSVNFLCRSPKWHLFCLRATPIKSADIVFEEPSHHCVPLYFFVLSLCIARQTCQVLFLKFLGQSLEFSNREEVYIWTEPLFLCEYLEILLFLETLCVNLLIDKRLFSLSLDVVVVNESERACSVISLRLFDVLLLDECLAVDIGPKGLFDKVHHYVSFRNN